MDRRSLLKLFSFGAAAVAVEPRTVKAAKPALTIPCYVGLLDITGHEIFGAGYARARMELHYEEDGNITNKLVTFPVATGQWAEVWGISIYSDSTLLSTGPVDHRLSVHNGDVVSFRQGRIILPGQQRSKYNYETPLDAGEYEPEIAGYTSCWACNGTGCDICMPSVMPEDEPEDDADTERGTSDS